MMNERKFPDRLFNEWLFVSGRKHFTSTNGNEFHRSFGNRRTIAGL